LRCRKSTFLSKKSNQNEVWEKIGQIPEVRNAFVTAVPLTGGRQTEIATLVASDLTARELKAAIRSMDEQYSHPRRIRIVKAIPVLPNGKIDRQQVDRLFFPTRLS